MLLQVSLFVFFFSLKANRNRYYLLSASYGILVCWPGIEPMPSEVEVWSLNHLTTREFPKFLFFFFVAE